MLEILLILLVVASSCALLGVLLLLRENAMIADAISHTILLGIVIGFVFTHDLNSPWLIISATIFGVITVLVIELLVKSNRLKQDAALGLVFPLFFAIAVIIISLFFRNLHLDIDVVLLGEVIFAPLARINVFGFDLSQSLVQGIIVLILNLLFILITYNALKIRLFDEIFAKSIGIAVVALDIVMMTLVSLTSVVSFQSVGAILVIALMIGPAMSARCLTNQFHRIFIYSVGIAIVNCFIGYKLAFVWNVSISGLISVVTLITFLIIFTVTHLRKN